MERKDEEVVVCVSCAVTCHNGLSICWKEECNDATTSARLPIHKHTRARTRHLIGDEKHHGTREHELVKVDGMAKRARCELDTETFTQSNCVRFVVCTMRDARGGCCGKGQFENKGARAAGPIEEVH